MNYDRRSVGAQRTVRWSIVFREGHHQGWNASLGGKVGVKVLSPCQVPSTGLGTFFLNLLSYHSLSVWKSKP